MTIKIRSLDMWLAQGHPIRSLVLITNIPKFYGVNSINTDHGSLDVMYGKFDKNSTPKAIIMLRRDLMHNEHKFTYKPKGFLMKRS